MLHTYCVLQTLATYLLQAVKNCICYLASIFCPSIMLKDVMRTRVYVCAVYTVLEIYSQRYQGNHVYCKTLQYVVYTHTYVHNWLDLLMHSDGLILAQSWLRMVLNNEEWIWVLKGLTESQRALRWVCTDAKASRHSRCVYQRQVICAISVSWLCICSCLGFKCFTACHPCIWCNMEHIFFTYFALLV